jgi:transcriptional regulator with XRE-family HTH domain
MLLADLQNDARAPSYSGVMAKDANREILANNLRALMQRRGWTQQQLGNKSGISQTHIGNFLRKQVDPTTSMLDALGGAFHLPGWILLIPGLPIEILDSGAIPDLVKTYVEAARKPLSTLIAEREVSRSFPALPSPASARKT